MIPTKLNEILGKIKITIVNHYRVCKSIYITFS